MDAYTPYEKSSLSELNDAFASPFRTPVSALLHMVAKDGGSGELDGHRVRPLVRGLRRALLEASRIAARTVTPRAVCETFRRDGYRQVNALTDVRHLELWEVDEVTVRLRPKYLIAGAVLGVATGGMGVAGACLDVPAVTLLALRAINEYALHYGFDPRAPRERAFALRILTAALSPSSNVRESSVEELALAGAAVAREWENKKPLRLIAPIALAIGRRVFRTVFTRRDQRALSKVGGHLGSILGATANAWLLLGVTRAAQSAYRERRLGRALRLSIATR